MYCYNCTTSNDTNTKTYTTTNVSNTPTANYAKSGDGAARITFAKTVILKNINSNSTYGEVCAPSKDGYVFKGWNTKQDGSGTYVTSSSELVSNNDHTLYAIWETLSVPTFTYTGTYEVVDDYDNEISNLTTYVGNWKIRFLTSGTLSVTNLKGAIGGIDIFLVGGGGGGGYFPSSKYGSAAAGGSGIVIIRNHR